jgi:hypothetical protein
VPVAKGRESFCRVRGGGGGGGSAFLLLVNQIVFSCGRGGSFFRHVPSEDTPHHTTREKKEKNVSKSSISYKFRTGGG